MELKSIIVKVSDGTTKMINVMSAFFVSTGSKIERISLLNKLVYKVIKNINNAIHESAKVYPRHTPKFVTSLALLKPSI